MALVLGALSGCGSDAPLQSTPLTPSVESITAGQIMYSRPSQFTVKGVALTGTVVKASGACSRVTEVTGGTATVRQFTCTPSAAGDVTISVASGGTVLQQSAFAVPTPQVTLTTDAGAVVVELDPVHAPKSVNNFLLYVWDGFYTNVIFNRVEVGFVIQGGGYGSDGKAKQASHPTLELEPFADTQLSNTVGTIAMARTDALNSATSQFFFNLVDNIRLDTQAGGYAVFGKVLSGMDVVSTIGANAVYYKGLSTDNSYTTCNVLKSAVQTK